MQPIKDTMSGLPVCKRLFSTGRRTTRASVVGATLVLATFSLALFGSAWADYPSGYARAGHQNGMSTSEAGIYMSPHFGAAPVAKSSAVFMDPAQNEHKMRQAELKQILRDMTNRPTKSLVECNDWANVNNEYNQLIGIAQRHYRQQELRKNRECGELQEAYMRAQKRLEGFKNLAKGEDGQLTYVGNLLFEYLTLKQDMMEDPQLERGFEELSKYDPELRTDFENIQEFAKYAQDVIPPKEEAPKVGQGAPNDLDELEREIRKLVDRERELNEDETSALNQLANQLEKTLNDDRKVDVISGRFTYLTGTLNAARAAVLHKLNEEAPPAEEPQVQHVARATAGRGPAAEAMSFANSHHDGPSTYVFAQSGHGAPPAKPQEAAQQPGPESKRQNQYPPPGMRVFAGAQNGGPAGTAVHAGADMSHHPFGPQ